MLDCWQAEKKMKKIFNKIFTTYLKFFAIYVFLLLFFRYLSAWRVRLYPFGADGVLFGVVGEVIISALIVLLLFAVSAHFSYRYIKQSLLKAVSVGILALIMLVIIPFFVLPPLYDAENCIDMCGLMTNALQNSLLAFSAYAAVLNLLYVAVIKYLVFPRRYKLLALVLFLVFGSLFYVNNNLFYGCVPDRYDEFCFAKKAVEKGDYSICEKARNIDDCFLDLVERTKDKSICEKYLNKKDCFNKLSEHKN